MQGGRPHLFTATVSRKRTEQDALLLRNRIQLLRLEEERALQKTKETEKKAADILTLRERNLRSKEEQQQAESDLRRKQEAQRNLVQKRKEQLTKGKAGALGQEANRKKMEHARALEERRMAEEARKIEREEYRREAEETRHRIRRER